MTIHGGEWAERTLLGAGCILYFLPMIIASRQKKSAGAIGALNFFLDWTLIGWIVALVWIGGRQLTKSRAN